MKLNKSQRSKLKMKFGGHCSYCGILLGDIWQADHLIPIRRSGDGTCMNPEYDALENLMPACSVCNKNKHSYTLDFWRESLEDLSRKLHDYVPNFRLAVKYGLIDVKPKPVVFFFETYNVGELK